MPNSIKTGGGSAKFEGTATASQVLSGATFYSNDKEIKTGTMTNRGAVTKTLNCGGSYTIPAGYHNGSGKVTANSLASQTDGTATASQILSGKTAYVDGAKVTGTMINCGAMSLTIPANGICLIPEGYHDGSGKVTQELTTLGTTTWTPTTSNQTIAAGTYCRGAQTIKGDSNLVASNIKSGTSIFGVSGSYVGGCKAKSILSFYFKSSYNAYTKTFNFGRTINLSNTIVNIQTSKPSASFRLPTDTTLVDSVQFQSFTSTNFTLYSTASKVLITVIEFESPVKSIQIIDAYSGTNTLTMNAYTSNAVSTAPVSYFPISTVNEFKSIILGSLRYRDSDYNDNARIPAPLFWDSTRILAGIFTTENAYGLNCAVVEFQ